MTATTVRVGNGHVTHAARPNFDGAVVATACGRTAGQFFNGWGLTNLGPDRPVTCIACRRLMWRDAA